MKLRSIEATDLRPQDWLPNDDIVGRVLDYGRDPESGQQYAEYLTYADRQIRRFYDGDQVVTDNG